MKGMCPYSLKTARPGPENSSVPNLLWMFDRSLVFLNSSRRVTDNAMSIIIRGEGGLICSGLVTASCWLLWAPCVGLGSLCGHTLPLQWSCSFYSREQQSSEDTHWGLSVVIALLPMLVQRYIKDVFKNLFGYMKCKVHIGWTPHYLWGQHSLVQYQFVHKERTCTR